MKLFPSILIPLAIIAFTFFAAIVVDFFKDVKSKIDNDFDY